MSLTTTQQISIGRICSVLASNELNQGKPTGGQLDEGLPLQLWAITEGLEMLYDLSPSNADLIPIGNDLISKCRHYARATTIINSGGTIPDISTPTIIKSPIRIRSSDFTDATSWDGENEDGVEILSSYILEIFADNINQRFLDAGSDWVRTTTGFTILVPGFDANVNSYILYIYISP